MKKILIILTTILLSITIAGCSKLSERYDNDIKEIINDINTNEFKDKKQITRDDIDIKIFNISYDSEKLTGKHLTYQINYLDPSNSKNILTLLFYKDKSKVSRLSDVYNYKNTEKILLYKENHIKLEDYKYSNYYLICVFILLVAHLLLISHNKLNITLNKFFKPKPTNTNSNGIKNSPMTINNTSNNNLSSNLVVQTTNKNTFTNKNRNKLFVTYSNIIISFLATIYAIRKYNTLNSQTPLPFAPSRGIEDLSDLIFYILVMIFLFAVFGLFYLLTTLIKKKLHQVLLLITSSSLVYCFFMHNDLRTLIFVTFLFFLEINYIIIKSLPKLYTLLSNKTPNNSIIEKLTLLWAILSFLLGVIFNLKN